jgi:hypothetical protein
MKEETDLEQKGHEIDSFFSNTNNKHTSTPKGNSFEGQKNIACT